MFTETDDSTTFLAIADMDEWSDFWADNGEEIEADYDCSHETALRLALNCSLVIGGGAAPLYRIGFVD